jgi:uncharacterized membrane protein
LAILISLSLGLLFVFGWALLTGKAVAFREEFSLWVLGMLFLISAIPVSNTWLSKAKIPPREFASTSAVQSGSEAAR